MSQEFPLLSGYIKTTVISNWFNNANGTAISSCLSLSAPSVTLFSVMADLLLIIMHNYTDTDCYVISFNLTNGP